MKVRVGINDTGNNLEMLEVGVVAADSLHMTVDIDEKEWAEYKKFLAMQTYWQNRILELGPLYTLALEPE